MTARRSRASPVPEPHTPAAYGRAIVRAFEARGLAPDAVLAQARITPRQLADRQGRLSARQMELLSGAAMVSLDDEALGAFRRRLPWGSYGMLARASITSSTLGLALRRWCRHHALLTDDLRIRLETVETDAEVVIEEAAVHQGLAAEARELSLVHLLRNLHGLACWFIDSRIPLQEVRLPFEAPPHADAFGHMFPGPARFGAAHAGLRFDARYLELPLKRDERALGQMLQRALPLTVLQYRRDRLLVPQVRQALRNRPEQCRSAEDLARLLHVSTRTLHRQLRDEGAGLQQLKDQVRCEQAQSLLWRSDKPIKQIAQAVGFRNEKSFIRAFRGWTGRTPGDFRSAGGVP